MPKTFEPTTTFRPESISHLELRGMFTTQGAMLRSTIWLPCNLLRCGVGNGAVAASENWDLKLSRVSRPIGIIVRTALLELARTHLSLSMMKA